MAQYRIMDEPTDAEFRAFFKVERYFEEMQVAQWLDNAEEQLTDAEFNELVYWFHMADFGQEENDYIAYEYERIISER